MCLKDMGGISAVIESLITLADKAKIPKNTALSGHLHPPKRICTHLGDFKKE